MSSNASATVCRAEVRGAAGGGGRGGGGGGGIGYRRVEFLGRVEFLQRTALYDYAVAPRRCRDVFSRLRRAVGIDVDARDPRLGATLRGHQGHQPAARADVEYAARALRQAAPRADQNPVGAHLHGASAVVDVELLERESSSAHGPTF